MTEHESRAGRHTLGPWEIANLNDDEFIILGPSTGSTHFGRKDLWEVAKIDLFMGLEAFDRAQIEANARLIAAAPELLAALEAALPYVAKYESEHESNVALDVYIKGSAALALATSEPKDAGR